MQHGSHTVQFRIYFTSKGEILLSVANIETEKALITGAKLIDENAMPPAEAYNAIFMNYFHPQHLVLSRQFWRLCISISFSNLQTSAARRFRDIDQLLCNQVIELTERLQACGELRPEIDCAEFGRVLFNNVNMMFFEFNRSEWISLEELLQQIEDSTKSMVALASPPKRSA